MNELPAIDFARIRRDHPISQIVPRYVTGERVMSGRKYWLCPFHSEKTPSFTIREDGSGFVCFGCDRSGDVLDFIRQIEGLDMKGALEFLEPSDKKKTAGSNCPTSQAAKANHGSYFRRPKKAETQISTTIEPDASALAIWKASQPINGTLGDQYFRSRGISLSLPPSLRFHPSLSYFDGSPNSIYLPAVVSAVQAPDRRIVAIHRTYLDPRGERKAQVSTPKKMLGPTRGGAVRLAAAGERLLVGEGLESALSAMQATEIPGWAALSTSGLRALVLPDVVREIVIAADGDQPGELAAQEAAERWTAEGRKVRIARPPAGMDFNDVLMAGAAHV